MAGAGSGVLMLPSFILLPLMPVGSVWIQQVLADGAASGTDMVSFFAQYGPLGVITALLIWFARGAYQRERDKVDRLEEDNRRLNDIILDRVIPVLTAATQAAEQSAEQLRMLQRERERAALIDEQQRTAKGGNP
jgi:hypothetical protein